MDIEWAKDGADGKLYILQARPETVKSRKRDVEQRYALKGSSRVLASGRAIGHKIGSGAVRVGAGCLPDGEGQAGRVLVTDMTDPNWEPVMKLAAAIVTNRGGRTCPRGDHRARARHPRGRRLRRCHRALKDGQPVTVLRRGGADTRQRVRRACCPSRSRAASAARCRDPVKIAMNVGNPDLAFEFAQLAQRRRRPGAPRIHHQQRDRVHRAPCLEYADLPAPLKKKLAEKSRGYADPPAFFREKMVEGVA